MNGLKDLIREHVFGGLRLACLHRRGAAPAVVFVHGLGGAKENFLGAFEHARLGRCTLLAADLVGFGDSVKPADFSYDLSEQAALLRRLIDRVGIDKFHLVAHSMGGIVGVHLAKRLPERVRSFINAEGNLSPADCFLTARIARAEEAAFRRTGFEELKRELARQAESTADAGLRAFLPTLAKATWLSVHRSSLSTVRECESGDLLRRYAGLRCAKRYLFGERNRGGFPIEEQLRQSGIPVGYVPESGHAMMEENPDAFYSIVHDTVCARG